MSAKTIDAAIAQLDAIIDECRRSRSRLGYFAALYRKVTVEVKRGIEAGEFQDCPRMERLDVIFANRYLDAYQAHRRGEKPTRSWLLAFQRANTTRLLILQHLLLGMNAHINLDLGIAAARTSPGKALPTLQQDFNQINAVLGRLMTTVQQELAAVSPNIGVLDTLAGRADSVICNFSMEKARTGAWLVATELAPLPTERQERRIVALDRRVYGLGLLLSTPMGTMSSVVRTIARDECQDIAKVIDTLV